MGITLTVDGLNWVRFMTLTRRRWIVELLYNSVHRKFNLLERRCWNEEHVPERLGPQVPGWAAQENGKETLLWPWKWGSICCSSVQPPTQLSLSKTFSNPFEPFQIKWEVYFSKELCPSSSLPRYVSACICVCIVVMAIQQMEYQHSWVI